MRLSVLAILFLGLCVALTPVITAADVSTPKVPDAKKVLKSVFKTLKKNTAKSNFGVNCTVRGGVSKAKDHSLASLSVNQDYEADVYRGMMYLSSLDMYRNVEKGALRNGQNVWQNALASADGVLAQRLMNFPHLILAEALRSPKSVEWVWVGDELDVDDDEEDSEAEATEGHTVVVKRKTTGEKAWKGMPHLMRVTMNPKTALTQFNETVNNSNCVGGG